jgi:hypothetical protein
MNGKIGSLMRPDILAGGLEIGLINNKIRNQFYDEILKKCKNKKCIEVGAGSGLLSLIALKHGAIHITCFEQEINTYMILKNAVQHCGLQDKITLINEKFTSDSIHKHHLHDCDLIFHELLGSNMWNDDGWPIRNTFDKKIDVEIIPNKLIGEFYIAEIHEVNRLFKPGVDAMDYIGSTKKIPKFDPGIQIDEKFVQFYNHCIDKFNSNTSNQENQCLFRKVLFESQRGFFEVVKEQTLNKLDRHCFDLNTSDYSETIIRIKLPKAEKPYMLLPTYKVECDESEMVMTTLCGFYAEAFVIFCDSDDAYFELDTLNGTIKIDNRIAFNGAAIWY